MRSSVLGGWGDPQLVRSSPLTLITESHKIFQKQGFLMTCLQQVCVLQGSSCWQGWLSPFSLPWENWEAQEPPHVPAVVHGWFLSPGLSVIAPFTSIDVSTRENLPVLETC